MSSLVCVDASFMVTLVLPEADSEHAEALWERWLANETAVHAPALMPFEATSAIRKQVQRSVIAVARGEAAAEAFSALAQDIILMPAADLSRAAWSLADRYQRPNLYDAYYVALAERLDCPLWSSDDRLRRVMPSHADRILSPRS